VRHIGHLPRIITWCTVNKYKKAQYLHKPKPFSGRSQWPCGLRRRSAAARLLRLWVRMPTGAWMFVCCECYVLQGRGHCDELITRPEETYRLWYVVVCDLQTSWMRRPWPTGRCRAKNKQTLLRLFYVRIPHTNTYTNPILKRLHVNLWIFVNNGFYQSVVLVAIAIQLSCMRISINSATRKPVHRLYTCVSSCLAIFSSSNSRCFSAFKWSTPSLVY